MMLVAAAIILAGVALITLARPGKTAKNEEVRLPREERGSPALRETAERREA